MYLMMGGKIEKLCTISGFVPNSYFLKYSIKIDAYNSKSLSMVFFTSSSFISLIDLVWVHSEPILLMSLTALNKSGLSFSLILY